MEYKLKHPKTVDGEALATLELRRPCGRDMRAVGKVPGDTEKSLLLLQNLAGLTPDQVDALDGEDINAVSEIIAGFFGVHRPT